MNTCNYQTPYPVASHEEGGVLYSNGVQVVTVSNPPMIIRQGSIIGNVIMLVVGFIGVITGYYIADSIHKIINYIFDRK